MKRLILTVAAFVMLAVPAAQAQKVNKEAITANLAKQDDAVADAKKNTKASTWMARGKAYYEALVAPTKDLADNVPQSIFESMAGKPREVGSITTNQTYTTLVYPYVTAYVGPDGNVAGWTQTREVKKGLLETAVESYVKALELDPKQKAKVVEALDLIYNYCLKGGQLNINVANYAGAIDYYEKAYLVKNNPAYEQPETENLFTAGQLAALVANGTDVEMSKRGANFLETAAANGYVDESGNLYYYLYHCYYGQRGDKNADPEGYAAAVAKSRDALLEGIAKYPKNENILECLMSLYTTEEGAGDPMDLIGIIEQTIAESPTNADLWDGRGLVYYRLKNYDESIKSFQKVVELNPNSPRGYYLLGAAYMSQAENAINEINERHYTVQSEYDKDFEAANALYRSAVPHLEKAIELNPNDTMSLEWAKQLYFRFRDEGDNMDKYNAANERLNAIRANQ
ncbi:MAG: tetratricopeptide repeat protein [Alistipes sp.]|nr:tetratricopeptide repeat protein [Alistipes sp.]